MKTAVVGVGMVGGALARYLPEPILYDKFKEIGSLDEVNSADIVFVAVPTPYDEEKGGFDLDAVEETLGNIEGEKIVQFREKPMIPYWANVGLHLFNKDVKFPETGSLENDVLPVLAKQGKLKAYKHEGFWHTVNTVKDLEEVEEFIKKK